MSIVQRSFFHTFVYIYSYKTKRKTNCDKIHNLYTLQQDGICFLPQHPEANNIIPHNPQQLSLI